MDRRVKKIAILGSTGSVGRQTLDVVRSFPGEIEVVALCAGRNTGLLLQQVEEFRPSYYYCDPHAVNSVTPPRTGISRPPRTNGHSTATTTLPVQARALATEEIAVLPEVDIVVAAMSGSAGMGAVLAALKAGKTVALANKEPMVIAGESLMRTAKDRGGRILPVDSEPSAIWQCIQGEKSSPRKLFITASGGAFRDRTWGSLRDVTPAEALRHPTWQMGPKITVDSATLMNKAFEVIEARWLFGIPYEQIDVVVHRQSIIHSMVEFVDGSVKAQLAPPDLRYPIQYALFYPERRVNHTLPGFDPVKVGQLTFEAMRSSLYPCFEIAMDYARRGGTWPAVLAGADEAAVWMFLDGKARFTDMPDLVTKTLSRHVPNMKPSLDDAVAAAAWAFEETLKIRAVN